MPIATLFIEGKLDAEVLNPILEGRPVLRQGGSKNSLKPRALVDRRESGVNAGYLRDRDFDFDPPSDLSRPTVDAEEAGTPFGWRWCRHEIENYLIDPLVICEVMAWPLAEVEEAIRQSARRVRSYEAARWVVGTVRQALPPHYKLRTRPDGLNKIDLPVALDPASVSAWASNSIETHRQRLVARADAPVVQRSFDDFSARFDEAFLARVTDVLLWFSGKDILAGMSDWLTARSVANPGAFLALLRDWIIANSERTLELLPEWSTVRTILRA